MEKVADRWDRKTGEMLYEAGSHLQNFDASRVLNEWKGWAGHEAVAASLWCFLQAPTDFRKAVLLAVNSPGDSDSLGAITGALVGGHLGISGIPNEWRRRVEDSIGLEQLAHRVCKALEG